MKKLVLILMTVFTMFNVVGQDINGLIITNSGEFYITVYLESFKETNDSGRIYNDNVTDIKVKTGNINITDINDIINILKNEHTIVTYEYGINTGIRRIIEYDINDDNTLFFKYDVSDGLYKEYHIDFSNYFGEGGLSTNEIEVNDFSVYPNPVVNNLNIDFTTDNFQEVEVVVYDMNGRVIHTEKTNTKVNVDIGGLDSGMYIVKVGNEIKKVIKQ